MTESFAIETKKTSVDLKTVHAVLGFPVMSYPEKEMFLTGHMPVSVLRRNGLFEKFARWAKEPVQYVEHYPHLRNAMMHVGNPNIPVEWFAEEMAKANPEDRGVDVFGMVDVSWRHPDPAVAATITNATDEPTVLRLIPTYVAATKTTLEKVWRKASKHPYLVSAMCCRLIEDGDLRKQVQADPSSVLQEVLAIIE